MKDTALVVYPPQRLRQIGSHSARPIAGHAAQRVQIQSRRLCLSEEPVPGRRRRLVGHHDRWIHHARDAIGKEQHHARRPAAQPRPQPVGRHLPRAGDVRQLVGHRLHRPRPRPVQPALHGARAQVAARGVWRVWVERPPQPPAFLPPEPRAQQLRGPAQRRAAVLPVIDRAALHFPRIPAAAHEPRRGFGIAALAAPAPMPLHRHRLPPGEGPRVPRVRAVLPGVRPPARRAAPPVPRRPLRQHT